MMVLRFDWQKSLADNMDFSILEDKRNDQRARIKARFKLPSPEDLSPLVENWDSEKLNSLSRLPDRNKFLRASRNFGATKNS